MKLAESGFSRFQCPVFRFGTYELRIYKFFLIEMAGCYIGPILLQAERSFTIDAIVILPEHLHAIWTLPESDADYSSPVGHVVYARHLDD
jgi:hypothetical protein